MKPIALIGAILFTLLAGLTGYVGYDLYRYARGDFKIDLGPVVGFAERYSYQAGDPIALKVHAAVPARLVIRRLDDDWVAVGAPIAVPVARQSPLYNKHRGFDWAANLTVGSEGLTPGLYQFRLETTGGSAQSFAIPIIIKDDRPRSIGVVLATNTWDAYNVFGGTSHYEIHQFNSVTRLLIDFYYEKIKGRTIIGLSYVPRARPNGLFDNEANVDDLTAPYSSFIVRSELDFIRFLRREGYDFNVFSDRDLVDDPRVLESDLLVFPGHSEYWSSDMFYALERYMHNGGRVYRSIAGLEGGGVVETEDGLSFGRHTEKADIVRLTGAATTADGELTSAPYRTLCADFWAFRGTDLANNDLFGADSLNRPSFDLPGHDFLRKIVDVTGQPQRGASGIFTSKIAVGSGAFALLARGTNPRGGADMVYRDLPAGGWVFNASSAAFNGALAIDPQISRIVRNLMDEASGRLQRPTTPPDCRP